MSPKYKSDSPRLAFEFNERLDPKARAMFLDLDDYCYFKYGLRLIITCIERTSIENKAVKGQKYSAHLKQDGYYVRAVDIRSSNLSTTAIADLVARGKRIWGDSIHILHHEGTAWHIHLNVNRFAATKWPKEE